jgi:citrate synthase
MSDKAQIILDGKTYEFPIITGTEGEKAIDISKLRDAERLHHLDPGYKNTGATTSAITFLDGEEGILQYRGYPSSNWPRRRPSSRYATCSSSVNCPTSSSWTSSREHPLPLAGARGHEALLRALPGNAHPMGILSAMVNSLSTFYPRARTRTVHSRTCCARSTA